MKHETAKYVSKYLTDTIFETSAYRVPSKSKNPTVLGQVMSNFAMGTILGKSFAQAQVHTNHSTSAEGTSAVMYARVLVQNPFPRLSPWRSCIL